MNKSELDKEIEQIVTSSEARDAIKDIVLNYAFRTGMKSIGVLEQAWPESRVMYSDEVVMQAINDHKRLSIQQLCNLTGHKIAEYDEWLADAETPLDLTMH